MKSFRIEAVTRSVFRIGLGLLLLLPYMVWIARISAWQLPSIQDWQAPLRYAMLQASLSAFFSCVGGFILFHSLQAWRHRSFAEIMLLLPNVIPPLFLALSLFSLVTPFARFPYGLSAVIVAHVLLNSGLAAVALDQIVRSNLGGLVEAVWVMGAKPIVFWREIAWPLLRADMINLFLFIFSICLASFSLPLLLSGAHSVTLEVAVYDAIRTEGRWDLAVTLAAWQTVILLILAWLLPSSFWPMRARGRHGNLGLLAWPMTKISVLLPALVLLSGWLVGILASTQTAPFPAAVRGATVPAFFGTLTLGLSVGLLHLLLYLVTAYVLPHRHLDRFLNGYLAPSSALVGFGLLALPGEGRVWSFLKLTLALTLISYPLLYRWVVHSSLSTLRRQIVVAYSMGATWSDILFEIVWPQAGRVILRASGVAGVWACGDFALSEILLTRNFASSFSLPMLITDLIGNYRFELATLILLPVMLASLVVYLFFVGAARYVTR